VRALPLSWFGFCRCVALSVFLSLSLSLSVDIVLPADPPARAPLTLDDTLSLLRADPRPWSRSRQPWRWQRHRWKRPRSQTTSSS
jgi:hypothetical protein